MEQILWTIISLIFIVVTMSIIIFIVRLFSNDDTYTSKPSKSITKTLLLYLGLVNKREIKND